MGLAYGPLSKISTAPVTVVDAWVASGTMQNKIGFRACPYSQAANSWVDFGNTDGYTKCGNSGPVAYTISPVKSYYTINLQAVRVNGIVASFPSAFQVTDYGQVGGYVKAWSVLDSCSSMISIPSVVLGVLQAAVLASNGLPSYLTTQNKADFVGGNIAATGTFVWSRFPTISFDMPSDAGYPMGVNATLRLTLGPQQYIQQDSTGFCILDLI